MVSEASLTSITIAPSDLYNIPLLFNKVSNSGIYLYAVLSESHKSNDTSNELYMFLISVTDTSEIISHNSLYSLLPSCISLVICSHSFLISSSTLQSALIAGYALFKYSNVISSFFNPSFLIAYITSPICKP